MKSKISRILSIALILAMLVGVIPTVLAVENPAGSIKISGVPEESVAIRDKVTLTADVEPADGYTVKGNTIWNCDPADGAAVSDGSFSATKPGTYTVTATATLAKEGSDDVEVSDQCQITVDYSPVEQVKITVPEELGVGQQGSISATIEPSTANQNVTWTQSGEGEVSFDSDGKITGMQAGQVTVTATSQADNTKYASATILVKESEYTVSLSQTSIELLVNGEQQLTVSVKQGDRELNLGTDYTVEWSGTGDYFSYTNGLVKGLKAGENGSVTATVTVGNETREVTCTVKVVNDGTLSCDGADAEVGSTIVLRPSLVSEEKYDDVKYTFEVVSGKAKLKSSTSSTATYTSSYSGVSTISVTATFDDDKQSVSKVVNIAFYTTPDIEVTLKDGISTFRFDDDDVFSKVVFEGTTTSTKQTMTSLMLDGVESEGKWVSITVSTSSEASGKLTNAAVSSLKSFYQGSLDYTVFTADPEGNGKYVCGYNIKTDDGLRVVEGNFTINYEYAGDISYSTSFGTAVTFDEADFEDFWDAVGSGTFAYITFSNPTKSNGTLYTDTSKKTAVTASMKFDFNHKSSSSYKDIDTVTYVPDKDRTTAYSDTYEFVAYNTAGSKFYGTVLVNVGGSVTDITARGIAFGSGKLTDLLVDTFKQEKGTDLNYITFTLPDADEGKLLYGYSTMLNSQKVKATDKFYVDPSKSQMDLDDVVFVPAAGTYGKVTLYYKAYGSSESISYSGFLTLTVTEKTKSAVFSDVTASSYSWAADSVDFLYYEEVANGSNGKYNPKSNITRGDFMLMLYRAFLEEKYGNYNVTTNFPDVVKGTTSYSKETYQAVGVAKYLGIAQGSNGKYNPKAYITREEAMTLIYRTLDEVGYSMSYTVSTSTSSFSDYSSVSSYAKAAIKDLIGHGVVIGTNGKIQPKSNITRAEMAVILHRVLTY